MSDAPIEADLLDQTLYIAGKIYDDPGTTPIPLDLHSACAIGSYDSVYDAIAAGRNINVRNKGIYSLMITTPCLDWLYTPNTNHSVHMELNSSSFFFVCNTESDPCCAWLGLACKATTMCVSVQVIGRSN